MNSLLQSRWHFFLWKIETTHKDRCTQYIVTSTNVKLSSWKSDTTSMALLPTQQKKKNWNRPSESATRWRVLQLFDQGGIAFDYTGTDTIRQVNKYLLTILKMENLHFFQKQIKIYLNSVKLNQRERPYNSNVSPDIKVFTDFIHHLQKLSTLFLSFILCIQCQILRFFQNNYWASSRCKCI